MLRQLCWACCNYGKEGAIFDAYPAVILLWRFLPLVLGGHPAKKSHCLIDTVWIIEIELSSVESRVLMCVTKEGKERGRTASDITVRPWPPVKNFWW